MAGIPRPEVFVGAGLAMVQTPVGSLVRRSCHESDSALYSSANFCLSHLCWFGSYLLAGYVGSAFGLANAFVIPGLISRIAMVIAGCIHPSQDPVEIEHAHKEIVHSHHYVHDGGHHQPDAHDELYEVHQNPLGAEQGHRHKHKHRRLGKDIIT